MEIPNCEFFTGYKPCKPGKRCEGCRERKPISMKILIINLDAMGHVLMTTAMLPPLKRRYPDSYVIWVTLPKAMDLLLYNPLVNKVMPYDFETISILQAMRFDLVLNVDKAMRSAALAMLLNAKEKRGFGLNENGALFPLNPEAEYAFQLGIDDELKFKKNTKTGQQILTEAMGLEYARDEYILNLSPEEKEFVQQYRKEVGIKDTDFVVGFNTGCSELYPNKKMTVEQHVYLIDRIHREMKDTKVVLLGGEAEKERNAEIQRRVKGEVINSPTTLGLRKGICFIDACDAVVTGDTLGMHIAIGLKKYVIAWFGVTCAQEVDLYERGEKIVSQLDCSPCWKRSCDTLECIKQLDLNAIYQAILRAWKAKRHGLLQVNG